MNISATLNEFNLHVSSLCGRSWRNELLEVSTWRYSILCSTGPESSYLATACAVTRRHCDIFQKPALRVVKCHMNAPHPPQSTFHHNPPIHLQSTKYGVPIQAQSTKPTTIPSFLSFFGLLGINTKFWSLSIAKALHPSFHWPWRKMKWMVEQKKQIRELQSSIVWLSGVYLIAWIRSWVRKQNLNTFEFSIVKTSWQQEYPSNSRIEKKSTKTNCWVNPSRISNWRPPKHRKTWYLFPHWALKTSQNCDFQRLEFRCPNKSHTYWRLHFGVLNGKNTRIITTVLQPCSFHMNKSSQNYIEFTREDIWYLTYIYHI